MAKKKKHKNDVKTDLPIIMDYGIGSISVYDPADIMPYNEPPISEQIRFKKLGKEMKSEFKWLVDKALSADKLKTARAVTLAGAITGNTTFDGSKDISIETSLKPLEEQDIPELSLSKIKDAGTAAACNTGTEAGQIPVIGEGGKLNEALIPQQTLTTDNVNEGKKNLYYTNERVTNYLHRPTSAD